MSMNPDPFGDPTPAELELMLTQAVEAGTGRPVNHGSIELNLAALRRSEAVLVADWRHLATCMLSEIDPERCAVAMQEKRVDLAALRQRIADLEQLQTHGTN